jgi:hypothetical protein
VYGQYQQFEEINAIEYKWIEACNNGALDEERKNCANHILALFLTMVVNLEVRGS